MLGSLALQGLLQEAGRSGQGQAGKGELAALQRWATGMNDWAKVAEERIRALEQELAQNRRFMQEHSNWARSLEERLCRLEARTPESPK
jgi:hypothetical protein